MILLLDHNLVEPRLTPLVITHILSLIADRSFARRQVRSAFFCIHAT